MCFECAQVSVIFSTNSSTQLVRSDPVKFQQKNIKSWVPCRAALQIKECKTRSFFSVKFDSDFISKILQFSGSKRYPSLDNISHTKKFEYLDNPNITFYMNGFLIS